MQNKYRRFFPRKIGYIVIFSGVIFLYRHYFRWEILLWNNQFFCRGCETTGWGRGGGGGKLLFLTTTSGAEFLCKILPLLEREAKMKQIKLLPLKIYNLP